MLLCACYKVGSRHSTLHRCRIVEYESDEVLSGAWSARRQGTGTTGASWGTEHSLAPRLPIKQVELDRFISLISHCSIVFERVGCVALAVFLSSSLSAYTKSALPRSQIYLTGMSVKVNLTFFLYVWQGREPEYHIPPTRGASAFGHTTPITGGLCIHWSYQNGTLSNVDLKRFWP